MFADFRLEQTQVRSLAITLAGVAFLVLSLTGSQWLSGLGLSGQILAMLVGVVSLGGLISFINYLLLRFWWARNFYGTWYYSSDSTQLESHGHFARVRFFVKDSSMKYRVQIFSVGDIDQVINPGLDPEVKGIANSRVVSFDGDDTIEILYEVTLAGKDSGLGVISLANVSSGETMTGRWVTARVGDAPRSGTSFWFREVGFRQFLASQGLAQTKPEKKQSQ
jgi:hypothetical protein